MAFNEQAPGSQMEQQKTLEHAALEQAAAPRDPMKEAEARYQRVMSALKKVEFGDSLAAYDQHQEDVKARIAQLEATMQGMSSEARGEHMDARVEQAVAATRDTPAQGESVADRIKRESEARIAASRARFAAQQRTQTATKPAAAPAPAMETAPPQPTAVEAAPQPSNVIDATKEISERKEKDLEHEMGEKVRSVVHERVQLDLEILRKRSQLERSKKMLNFSTGENRKQVEAEIQAAESFLASAEGKLEDLKFRSTPDFIRARENEKVPAGQYNSFDRYDDAMLSKLIADISADEEAKVARIRQLYEKSA